MTSATYRLACLSAVISAATFANGCKGVNDCAPGTILLKVPCPSGAVKPASFRVSYTKAGGFERELEPFAARCPETVLQISLGNYEEDRKTPVVVRVISLDEAGKEIETRSAELTLKDRCTSIGSERLVSAVAANCDSTASCVSPASPCSVGKFVCADGGPPMCEAHPASLPNGTTCGENMVCAGGACVACKLGDRCPIQGEPCKFGKIRCTTGRPTCEAEGEELEGKPCGGGMVCSSGICTKCVENAPCVPANLCSQGALACSGDFPTCVDKNSPSPDGAVCGVGMVCGNGICTSCSQGEPCAVANVCRLGITTCNSGRAICVESDNAPNGKSCTDGKVCASGVCSECSSVVGVACIPAKACRLGKLSCSLSGTKCDDAGGNAPDGQACGLAKVCSAGTCVTCVADKDCVPNNTVCKIGRTTCAAGIEACAETANAPNGASCGAGKVCSDGSCVNCAAGSSCIPTNPCHTGALSCDSGSVACMDSGSSVADGKLCGQDRVCRNGSCVTCTANQACTPQNSLCRLGKTSCSTGSSMCLDSGNINDGTSCGADMVCREGTCASCKDGTACTPPNVCHIGTQSCATGSATCVDSKANRSNGSACGTNLICKDGSCVSCAANVACPNAGGNPCKVGVTACGTGNTVCSVTGNAPNGDMCGNKMVCSEGACVACSEGDSCDPLANRCKTGKISCAGGMSSCLATGGNEPEGKECGTAANSTPTCNLGECRYTCKPGFLHCQGPVSLGCETAIGGIDNANCGGCNIACSGSCKDGNCIKLGQPCASTNACSYLGPKAKCLMDPVSYPSGFCSVNCDDLTCPSNSQCFYSSNNKSDTFCMQSCKTGSECPADYSCRSQPSGGRICQFAKTGSACIDNLDCSALGATANCKSAHKDGPTLPGGYCTRLCSASARCPNDELCFEEDVPGTGLCWQRCDTARTDQCRAGYFCRPTGLPGIGICDV